MAVLELFAGTVHDNSLLRKNENLSVVMPNGLCVEAHFEERKKLVSIHIFLRRYGAYVSTTYTTKIQSRYLCYSTA